MIISCKSYQIENSERIFKRIQQVTESVFFNLQKFQNVVILIEKMNKND